MPSYTSSSDFDILVRELPAARTGLAGILALLLCALGVIAWEIHWRNYGAEPGYYVNSDSLWAMQRRRIDNGEGDKTVIIGSSRILFNIQLDEWEQASGERPIQLALEGTSP
ncbi:MAG: hypothetical protein MJA83_14545, partial [Gammaproteobacteria bacterium]|nr:hypothetical protein [Gammaproteobacteria bacterium]